MEKLIVYQSWKFTSCHKIHFIFFQVAAKKYCNFEIPAHFAGVWRYLENADETEEFRQTCPADIEIEKAYFSVANKR